MTRAKTLEALKLDVRERVEVRLTTGSRRTLGEARRRRARRRRQEAVYSLAAVMSGVVVAAAVAYTAGLI